MHRISCWGRNDVAILIALLMATSVTALRPANAEESTKPVTMADLAGMTVHATIVYARTIRREGKVRNNHSHQEFTIRIGPADAIAETEKYTTIAERGRVVASRVRNHNYTLGKVTNRGSGSVVWALVDASLTRLNTRPEGARRMTYSFKRTATGFVCNLNAPYLREDGVGALKSTAMVGGTNEFLAIKQVSSTCRVDRS
jgi:hypothetical protein